MPTGGPCGAMPGRQLKNEYMIVSLVGIGTEEGIDQLPPSYSSPSSMHRMVAVDDGWYVI